jgi:fumarate hydratase subunit alpha
MAVVFAEVGQDAHIEGASLEDAVNAGVARGYEEGYLRKSVVADPLRRRNTGTTPRPCCTCAWCQATASG